MLTKKLLNLIILTSIITNMKIMGGFGPYIEDPDEKKLFEIINKTRNLEDFKNIIAKHPNFVYKKWPGDNLLLNIVSQKGLLEFVKFLVEEKNVDKDTKNYSEFDPIFFALTHDHIDIANYLYKKGARLNFHKITHDKELQLSKRVWDFLTNLIDQTHELRIAIKNDNFEKFKQIVESFPNIANLFEIYSDIYKLDPLQDACKHDKLEIIKYFIEEKKFNYENKNYGPEKDKNEKMDELLNFCNKLDTFKYLIKKGCKPKLNDNFGPIYLSAERGNLDIVKYLIEEMGEDPKKATEPAFYNAKLNIIKYLETIKPSRKNNSFKLALGNISNVYEDSLNNIFKNQEFLRHILTKYKNIKLKMHTGILSAYTLTEALICNPENTASILSTNGNLQQNKLILEKYLYKSEIDLEKNSVLKKYFKENIAIKFFIKAIQSCKQIQKLYKKTPDVLENLTNMKATNFLNNTKNTLLVLDALSHISCDDAATSIMEFSDYECFENTKGGNLKNVTTQVSFYNTVRIPPYNTVKSF